MRQTRYDKSLEADRARERERELFYAINDYANGRDTEGSRMVAEVLAKVRADRVKGALLGDPLRLRPEHRKIAEQERKEAAKAKTKVQKNRKGRKKGKVEPTLETPATPNEALVEESVPHPQNAWLGRSLTKSRGYSRRYLEEYQQTALANYERDYESAYGDALSVSMLGEKVDNSASENVVHIRRLEAQERLRRLRQALGERSMYILEAVVIGCLTPSEIYAATKHSVPKVSITDEIRSIAHEVAVFYGSKRSRKDPVVTAIDRLAIQWADEMIRAAQRSLMENRQPTSAGRSSAA